jgi:glycosyltransferase involved in cell wall biosynthesis
MSHDDMISFVVIAYNEATNIGATLEAIMGLDKLGDFEVVVVDDGSRDGTADIVTAVADRCPWVRVIALDQNRGRGHARSTGINAARGTLIATVDADIVLPADWLVRARAALRSNDAVGGTAVPDGDVAYLYKHFGLVPRAVGHTTAVTGSNALYRRSVFDVAEFDPRLREGEDSVLNHAMNRAGLACLTVPGLIVRHEENKSLGASLKWLFDIGRGATRQLFTLRKVRMPDLVTGAFLAALAFGLLIVAQGRVLLGVAIPVIFVLGASAQHVRSRFYLSKSHWARTLAAVAVNCLLLTAYFTGRLAGLTVLLRRGQPRQTLRTDAGGALPAAVSLLDAEITSSDQAVKPSS